MHGTILTAHRDTHNHVIVYIGDMLRDIVYVHVHVCVNIIIIYIYYISLWLTQRDVHMLPVCIVEHYLHYNQEHYRVPDEGEEGGHLVAATDAPFRQWPQQHHVQYWQDSGVEQCDTDGPEVSLEFHLGRGKL